MVQENVRIPFSAFLLYHIHAIGRGIIDVFSSICACYCIVFISKILERYVTRLSKGLAYIGKYSIIMLCVHIIELNLFPWYAVINRIGIPDVYSTGALILGKLVGDIGITVLLSRSTLVRKMFALK